MSTLQAANIQALSSATLPVIKDSAGTEYGRFCRAFISYNGYTGPTINSSFNVTSVTKNGTGDYTINFTNAFSDSNYCYTHNTFGGAGGSLTDFALYTVSPYGTAPSSSALRVGYRVSSNGTFYDTPYLCFSFFR